MQAIIIEDTPPGQALLERVVRSLWPSAQIKPFTDVRSTLAQWSGAASSADLATLDMSAVTLVIVASGLSGSQAPLLLQSLRKNPTHIPIIVIDDQPERTSVLLARRFRVESYLIKPIQPLALRERLREVFADSATPPQADPPDLTADPESPDEFVRNALNNNDLALPLATEQVEAAPDLPALPPSQRAQMLAQWAREPALVLRLLGIVNQGYYLNSTGVIETFVAATERVGLPGLICLIQEIGMYPGNDLEHPALLALQEKYLHDCQGLYQSLVELRRYSEFDLQTCKTASVLFRVGEMAVLQLLQRWVNMGGILSEAVCNEIVPRFSADAGARIKAVWQLPMPIRMRVGATYMLPQSALKIDSIAMRAAGLLFQGEHTAELDKLLGRLHISDDQSHNLKTQATGLEPTETNGAN